MFLKQIGAAIALSLILSTAAHATTATGECAFDINGQADQNPWVNANFTNRNGGTWRIASNVLRPAGIYTYTGSAYDGGSITCAMEVNATADDDEVLCGALDGNGDGFLLRVRSTAVLVVVMDNYVVVDSAASGTITFVADDLFTFTVTKGTPNSFSATRNGSPISLSASTYALSLATMEAAWQLKSENVGTAAMKSLAVVDGLTAPCGGGASLVTIIMQQQ